MFQFLKVFPAYGLKRMPHVPWVCLQFVIVVFPDHTHYFKLRNIGKGSLYNHLDCVHCIKAPILFSIQPGSF